MNAQIQTAKAYMTAGNMVAAKTLIDRILRDEPESQDAHALLIDYETKRGNFKVARNLCESSLSRWPDNPGIRSNYIMCTMQHGLVITRLLEVSRLLKAFERDFSRRRMDLLLMQGVWAIKTNNRGRARRIRAAIAKEYPDSDMATMMDRMIAKITDDLNLKESAAVDALGHDQNDASAHAELAFAQFDLCQFFAARRSAKRALALDPMDRGPLAVLRLSRLVWFPPFLISHVAFAVPNLITQTTSNRGQRFLVWMAILWAAFMELPDVIELAIIDSAPIASASFWIMGYFAWPMTKIIVGVRSARKRRVKPVRLSKY